MEKAQNIDAGLANAAEDLSVLRMVDTQAENYKQHPLVKQAIKIYTDEHPDEKTL